MNDSDDEYPPIRQRLRNRFVIPQPEEEVADQTPSSPTDYEVGYGRPPVETRFAKGRSGNPKGRPKGATSLKADIERALDERHDVVEDGKRRKKNARQIVASQLVRKAAKGDPRAIQTLIALDRDKHVEDRHQQPENFDEPLSEADIAMLFRRYLLRQGDES